MLQKLKDEKDLDFEAKETRSPYYMNMKFEADFLRVDPIQEFILDKKENKHLRRIRTRIAAMLIKPNMELDLPAISEREEDSTID